MISYAIPLGTRYVDVKIEKALEISFELPRRLVYEDVAVRIVQMNFDLLSHQCHTFKCSYSSTWYNILTNGLTAASTRIDFALSIL